ncbi:hypothetical protein GCM10023262_16070 [Bartonella pachyuromydis]|uniref:Uncharacterized protein n=1 Tax=Bartonella pachyuromydis TaxID=931097 RepID=A0ABP8VND2_9HYPH
MTNISKNTSVISIANKTVSANKQEPTKKYEFINEGEYIDGHFLTRIRALRDFGDVKKGDLGGILKVKIISLMRVIAGCIIKPVSFKMHASSEMQK